MDNEFEPNLKDLDQAFKVALKTDFEENAQKWQMNIEANQNEESINKWEVKPQQNNPLFPFKGMMLNKQNEGHTWRKYQKLHDLIFNGTMNPDTNREYDFHRNFFISELNNSYSKSTVDANKGSIPGRKEFIDAHAFFKSFPIVLLACSNYISGGELKQIFGVEFIKEKGIGNQKFWIHFSQSDNPKLVIHTRQLSMNVSNKLIRELADEIKSFAEVKEIVLLA